MMMTVGEAATLFLGSVGQPGVILGEFRLVRTHPDGRQGQGVVGLPQEVRRQQNIAARRSAYLSAGAG